LAVSRHLKEDVMTNRRLEPNQWRAELDAVSKEYEGRTVSLTTRQPDGTEIVEAAGLPLQGVSQDAPNRNRIAIQLGSADGQLTHEVDGVTSVSIEAGPRIVFGSEDGTTTTVAFR
jgi:hypothetical protein